MDCRDPNLRFDRPCLRAAVVWLRVRLILAGVWLSCCQAQEITRAEDLLKLSQEEAASARPVRLVGTVIGGSEIGRNRAVVHDGKSCAYIRNDALPDLVWENGAQVEVVGVSDPGGFAPIIVASSVRTLGHGPLPAPIRAVYEELLWGGLNGQWIEMRGVVRSCHWYPDLSPPGVGDDAGDRRPADLRSCLGKGIDRRSVGGFIRQDTGNLFPQIQRPKAGPWTPALGAGERACDSGGNTPGKPV